MKRRIRRIRRALKRAGLYNAFHITLIAVLLTGFCVILFNVKEPEREKEPETIQAHSHLHDFKSVKTVTKKDTGKQHENEPDDINADNNEEVQG